MKLIFLALCTASLFLLSCTNDRKSENANSTASPTFEVAPTSPVVPGAVGAPPASAIPSAGASGTAALNPAHGQPGHRCDIAVGAPLNSPSSAGAFGTPPPGLGGPRANVPPSPGSISPSFNTQPQTVTTAPGMNPPHGQPGHDCSIAVGAPLKK